MGRSFAVCAMLTLVGTSGCVDRVIWVGDEDTDTLPDSTGERDDTSRDDSVVLGCGDDEDCASFENCFAGTCVSAGALRVSLSWQVRSDFDLHLRLPSGVEIGFDLRQAEGGELDLDDCVAGDCRQPNGVHVENIVFQEAVPRGEYAAWVVNFDSRREGRFAIEIAGETEALVGGEVGRTPMNVSDEYRFEL